MIQLTFFVTMATLLTVVCRRALRNPNSHGFYRHFVFLGVALLITINAPYWLQAVHSRLQLLSWLPLFSSAAAYQRYMDKPPRFFPSPFVPLSKVRGHD